MPELPPDLPQRLREADADELLELLRRHAGELDLVTARQALRNPFLGPDGIEVLAAQRRLLPAYEVKRAMTLHPRTPETLALRFVSTLFWRDLMEAGLDTRILPTVRRAAERRLLSRLPGLAEGEKVAIARRASARVLERLRHDPSARVVRAFLDNPRATEGLVLPLLAHDDARADVLRAVARHRRWGVRYEVRLALCRHPHTPLAVALGLLAHLRKADLRKLAVETRVPSAVRRRAEVLLGAR